jgi:hypothetical protein
MNNGILKDLKRYLKRYAKAFGSQKNWENKQNPAADGIPNRCKRIMISIQGDHG